MPSSDREGWFDRFRGMIGEHRRERLAASGSAWNLDRYEIQERLGEGGAAIVYRARDRELGRMVALKALRETLGVDDAARERFRREAKVAALLAHPNVVSVYDIGETAGRLYIVMELVDGRPFNDVLGQRTQDVREMIVLLERMSRGVAAAHDQGIVHRDLKPANILIGRDGQPKVGDFGLAHIAGGEVGLTRTGAVMGTPLYMAPEQVRGRTGEISPRTDVYALGAILYEILTGRPPHIGGTVTEVYGKIVGEEPAAPRVLNSRVAADLATIALKALEKEPALRYATSREFADDLRRYLEGEAILAKPPGPVARGVKWARRHRTASAVLGMALLTVIAVPIGLDLHRRHAVAGFLETGRSALADFRRREEALGTLGKEEKVLAAGIEPGPGQGGEKPVWALRRRIARELKETQIRRADAIEAFTLALGVDGACREARAALAGISFADFERAEREGDGRAMAESERRVRMYDDGSYGPRLVQEGALELASNPSGAEVDLLRYEEADDLGLAPTPVKTLGVCPISKASLPAGSYLLVLRMKGYREVRYPVLVGRGTVHAGKVNLYTEEQVGPKFVHVPAGPFILGGDEDSRYGEERRVAETGDFFIARTETTRGEYLEFLNGIALERGAAEAQKRVPRGGPDGAYSFEWPEGGVKSIPPAVERLPLAAISWEDADDYCQWLTRKAKEAGSGAVYRLPRSEEWEKTARGADGRRYPWGNAFDSSFLSSATQGLKPELLPVGSRPKDESPFGVLDMAGSVSEICGDTRNGNDGFRFVRGANYVCEFPILFRATSKVMMGSRTSSLSLGFRVVKEAPRK